MILYNVTVKIDSSVHDEWLQWMKEVHIPDVLATGCFVSGRLMKLLPGSGADEDENSFTYSVQYLCNTIKEYEHYRDVFAPSLQAAHSNRYKNQFVAFRSLLEDV